MSLDMLNNPLNSTSVETHLGFYCRVSDSEPINTWDFDTLYKCWTVLGYFKPLAELGSVNVSYVDNNINNNINNNIADITTTIDNSITTKTFPFTPSADLKNRHQALALAAFIRGRNSDSQEMISCRHEKFGSFIALFKRISKYSVNYISEWNTEVHFTFDPNTVSQFASVPVSVTASVPPHSPPLE